MNQHRTSRTSPTERRSRGRSKRPVRRRGPARPSTSSRRRRPQAPAAKNRVLVALLATVVFLTLGGVVAAAYVRQKVADTVTKVGLQLLVEAPTTTTSPIELPTGVTSELKRLGSVDHAAVQIIRIDGAGKPQSSTIDMTPRISGEIARTEPRASQLLDAKVQRVQAAVEQPATKPGGSVYAAISQSGVIDPSIPLTIVTSGLENANPISFGTLGWRVKPTAVKTAVENSPVRPLPLPAKTTVVFAPVAGAQRPISAPQVQYRQAVWQQVLAVAGVPNPIFLTARAATNAPTPTVPGTTVAVPSATPTPRVKVDHGHDGGVICTLPSTTFAYGSAAIVNPEKVAAALRPCLDQLGNVPLLVAGSASYQGALTKAGKPATNPSRDQALSEHRANAVAALLVDQLGVNRHRLTVQGFGVTRQPDPGHPRSAANQVVAIQKIPTSQKKESK